MSLEILGMGTAFPPRALTQVEAARASATTQALEVDERRRTLALYRRSGVETRRSVLLDPEESISSSLERFYTPRSRESDSGPTTRQRMEVYEREAGALVTRAAALALADAAVSSSRITHLVTVSCTGFSSPGIEHFLIRSLDLSPAVARVHVGFMGCHGAFNALRVAEAFCAANPGTLVLLAAVELCTLHFSYSGDPEKEVANALFGDGAAAVICGHGGKRGGQGGRENPEPWQAVSFGSCILPRSERDMTWRIGDNGFEMTLSPRVPERLQESLRPWLEPWLAREGCPLESIKSWAIHPGGPRILSAIEASLGLPPDATEVSREVLSDVGNCSSPTVLCILDRLRQRRSPRPCVALGFGPGLSAEAVLFR